MTTVHDPTNEPFAEPFLSCASVSMQFGRRRVLDHVDLSVGKGEKLVLLGPNGAGKSTLLRLALGVLEPDSGSVRVLGHDPARVARVKERIGYVPDRPDVYGWMTCDDLFRLVAPHYPTWDQEIALDWLDRLHVPRRTRFRSLSRGEGMKAMLAAALAPSPWLLLLDEPFGGLDPVAREDVLRGVIEAIRPGPQAIVLTTHDLDVAARVADRILLLDRGQLRDPVDPADSNQADLDVTPRQLHTALEEASTR